jgi:hypothetical protein
VLTPQRMAKASRKHTTRVFTVSGGAGSTTAAWTRFSLARCRGFIRTAVSIRRSFMVTARQRQRKRVAITWASVATRVKGDKVVAFCDRRCNVIAPFVVAPGNRNESPLLRQALPEVMRIVREVGMDLGGTIVSLDDVYDCRANRKAIFNRGMIPNINPNPCGRKQPQRGRKPIFEPAIFKERFRTIEGGVCLGGQVPPATAALRAHQRRALRVQDPRLHDDQSPALLPDLILDHRRPLVEFHSGAARRDPACPRHAKKHPETAQMITMCSEYGFASALFLYRQRNPRRLPSKPATS